MSRAVIFGPAPVADWGFLRPYLRPDDAVICADGGRRAAQALGLTPDWYVAVSYTHLDVYKRQALCCAEKIRT